MNKQDCNPSQYYQEDFLASHSVQPGSGEARRMTVTSGQRCLELYKRSDPVGLLAKMLLESSVWSSTRCFLTWKRSATPARRLLFRLVPSMPRTEETAAQFWPTATTPRPHDSENTAGMYIPSQKQKDLAYTAAMFPTPIASDYKNRGPKSKQQGLPKVVKLFPTATTGAGMCGGSANYQRLKELESQGIISEEERRSMAAGNGGQLNPDWVEWLMGFPAGWTSLPESQECAPE